MSPLLDFLVAPRTSAEVAAERPSRARRARGAAETVAPSLGVLATARELPAAAAGVGLAIARGRPAALVCLGVPLPAIAVRAPARPAAASLAASLRTRDLDSCARGRLVLVAPPDGRFVDAATRALAAAGRLPTVLAVAARDEQADALLAARDAILVVLLPSTEPAMARLALAGAAALAQSSALTLTLDPIQRGLALAGVRAPRAVSAAVKELVA
jgi:hypothetical protein